MSLLSVRGLKVRYGGIEAVKGVDLDVDAGELVALIGANGAGKTSTLKALAGLLPPAAGEVKLGDTDLTRIAAHDLVRHGVALVPEGRGMFGRLTVAENLQMGAYARRDAEVGADLERIYGLFPRLRERRKQLAGSLSGGEQQMLAIGRAMMSRPTLLLLDEPSMGLAPIMVERIFDTILAIAAQGVTLLLVEQNARLALKISQRGYVMEQGRITLQAPSSELLDNVEVRRAYLGEA